jgi:DNA helicase-2/ATP-dependent DNA helicase PcrA
LFKKDGHIQLLSIHKAKGLEFDTVFHLDPWRIPSRFIKEGTEEYEQELNCRYVCETRFKKELYLINTKDFVI